MCCVNERYFKKTIKKIGKGWKVYQWWMVLPNKVHSEFNADFGYYRRGEWVKALAEPFQIFRTKKIAENWAMSGFKCILSVKFNYQIGHGDYSGYRLKNKNGIILANEIFVPKGK